MPSTAITRLTGATTNAERKDALQVIGRMCDQNQVLGKNDLRRLSDVIQKLITTGQDKILAHVFDVIPKILKAYANEDPMKEWLYVLLTGNNFVVEFLKRTSPNIKFDFEVKQYFFLIALD